MRVAFCGAHGVGKSTLLEQVAEARPRYDTLDEPYHLLEEEGHEHADPPSLEDFEAQLERALVSVEESGEDVLLDRSPADLLAYLLVHEDAEAFELEDWIERVRAAMASLDLVVLVPIEARVVLPAYEDRAYRQAVHDKLVELLTDGGLAPDLLVVHGDVGARVAQVLARLGA